MSASGGPRESPSASRSVAAADCGFSPPRAIDQFLEAVDVDVARRRLEDIARRPGRNRSFPEHLPQLRDIALNDLRRGRGCALAPELVDDSIKRHDLVPTDEQEREQGPLPPSAELELDALFCDCDRTEEAIPQLVQHANPFQTGRQAGDLPTLGRL